MGFGSDLVPLLDFIVKLVRSNPLRLLLNNVSKDVPQSELLIIPVNLSLSQ